MRIFTVCALVSLPFAAVASEAPSLTNRDVAVLAAAITHFASRSDTWPANPHGYIAVNPETEAVPTGAPPDAFLNELHEIRGRIPTVAVTDYARRNSAKYAVPATITNVARVRIQSVDQAGGRPIGLENREIATFITPYSPGYTADGTTALVRFSFNWSIHGAYATYILRMVQGQWIVVASELSIYL